MTGPRRSSVLYISFVLHRVFLDRWVSRVVVVIRVAVSQHRDPEDSSKTESLCYVVANAAERLCQSSYSYDIKQATIICLRNDNHLIGTDISEEVDFTLDVEDADLLACRVTSKCDVEIDGCAVCVI